MLKSSQASPVALLLPMDRMPGALPAGEIPFGMDDVIPAIRAVAESLQQIPGNLDVLGPGTVLAGFLASIDVLELAGVDQVAVSRAPQRMAPHHQTNTLRGMSAVTQTISRITGGEERIGRVLGGFMVAATPR